MSESESRSGEVIGDRGINVAIVLLSKTSGQRFQATFLHLSIAQNDRQKLAVGYMLKLGSYDDSRLLKNFLVVPLWIDLQQLVSYAVMLTRPEQVHRREMEILVGPLVARREAVSTASRFHLSVAAVVGIRANREQLSIVRGYLHAQPSARKFTQTSGRVLVRAVDYRAIDK